MRRLLLVLLLAGCEEANPPAGPGAGGGGGGGGHGGRADGGGGFADAGAPGVVTGRVCLVADARQPGACANLAGSGIAVRLLESGEGVVVSQDGTFELPAPATGDEVTVQALPDNQWFGGASRAPLSGDRTATLVV